MTIEELLNCSADKLDTFTEEQLLEWFKPYLNVTRPELAEKPTVNRPRKANEDLGTRARREKKFDFLNKMAADLGIDMKLGDD